MCRTLVNFYGNSVILIILSCNQEYIITFCSCSFFQTLMSVLATHVWMDSVLMALMDTPVIVILVGLESTVKLVGIYLYMDIFCKQILGLAATNWRSPNLERVVKVIKKQVYLTILNLKCRKNYDLDKIFQFGEACRMV